MKSKYTVPALEKGIRIIEALAQSSEPLGVTDLFALTDYPKSTIFTILNTLETLHYVQKVEENKYTLTLKLYNMAVNKLEKLEFRDIARPIMQNIASDLKFTVHLAILENGKAVYVEKVNGPGFVQFSTKVGETLYLHDSAVGKALAAFLPELTVLNYIEQHGMPESTSHTITDKDTFMAYLTDVRKLGYAIEDEEGEDGIRCIAAPVYDDRGKVIAALGITALRNQLPSIKFGEIGNLIKDYAMKISIRMGYKE